METNTSFYILFGLIGLFLTVGALLEARETGRWANAIFLGLGSFIFFVLPALGVLGVF